jgi:hypothetical protein
MDDRRASASPGHKEVGDPRLGIGIVARTSVRIVDGGLHFDD